MATPKKRIKGKSHFLKKLEKQQAEARDAIALEANRAAVRHAEERIRREQEEARFASVVVPIKRP